MKIAICTLIGYKNYGNRLQNFALQYVLESMGNEVVTIRNYTDLKESLNKRIIARLFDGTLFSGILNKLQVIRNESIRKQANRARTKSFVDFTDKYILESEFSIDEHTADFSFDRNIDCYVIGSDQVWNYTYNSFSSFDFAVYSEKPKISYAASFGVSSIPQEYKGLYKTGLEGLDCISVREQRGGELVTELTGRSAKVVLDPTLLLSRSQWESLSTHKKYHEKYILTYFLGGISKSDEEYIKTYAETNKFHIKCLVSEKDLNLWKEGPAEFINLFSQAEAVFTDSFHASVFSIIFEKYFEVFKRKGVGPSTNSRLETLLNDFNLNDRLHQSQNMTNVVDYGYVEHKLRQRQEASLKFLRDALMIAKRRTEKSSDG